MPIYVHILIVIGSFTIGRLFVNAIKGLIRKETKQPTEFFRFRLEAEELLGLMSGEIVELSVSPYHAEICLADIGFDMMQACLDAAIKAQIISNDALLRKQQPCTKI